MKLAPPHNTLQPLPANIQPAVSQSVQRTATPADVETIQNVQATQTNSSGAPQESDISPMNALAPVFSGSSLVIWGAVIAALVLAAGAVWLWRSF